MHPPATSATSRRRAVIGASARIPIARAVRVLSAGAALAALLLAALGAAAPARADPVRWDANGHWYDVVHYQLDWHEAESAASLQTWGGLEGHLATVGAAAENAFIHAEFGGLERLWLGGFQPDGAAEPDGGWQWVTGEAWGYTAWGGQAFDDPEPEDRLLLDLDGAWDDRDGTLHFGFVIEFGDDVTDVAGGPGGPGAPDASPPAAAIVGLRAAPNPCNPRTEVRFTLTRASCVRLRVFDLVGRTVHAGPPVACAPGPHALAWDGRDDEGRALPSGRYLCRLEAGGEVRTIPVILVR
jgi:hypothetical protein